MIISLTLLFRCSGKKFPERLPDTSIVIVFHNEAWSTLLRTVHSIIRTAPRALLKEILLVDDASERDFLGKELEDYVATLEVPVKVLRTGKRSGLIRARLIGAEQSTGQVITFLDAHCEVSIFRSVINFSNFDFCLTEYRRVVRTTPQ